MRLPTCIPVICRSRRSLFASPPPASSGTGTAVEDDHPDPGSPRLILVSSRRKSRLLPGAPCGFQAHRDGDLDLPPPAVLVEVLELMFRVVAETEVALDAVAEPPRLMEEARVADPSGVVAVQLYGFLRPLRWFDEEFLLATGIDVYTRGFDRARVWGAPKRREYLHWCCASRTAAGTWLRSPLSPVSPPWSWRWPTAPGTSRCRLI